MRRQSGCDIIVVHVVFVHGCSSQLCRCEPGCRHRSFVDTTLKEKKKKKRRRRRKKRKGEKPPRTTLGDDAT